jgi:DNA-binding transcriptional MerR regulator
LEVSETLWSLEELSQHSQRELEERKIPNPGGRVSQTLSARTIRYYTSLGLVDRPLSYDGGIAKYGPRHLLQLLAIKILQSEYLPLPEIQKQLFGRSEDELREIVEAASRREESAEVRPAARNETWLTRRAFPGLRLVVEERDQFIDWLRGRSREEAMSLIWSAVEDLTAGKL